MGSLINKVTLKSGEPSGEHLFRHDGKSPIVDGHPRDMWQYSMAFGPGETSLFEGEFRLVEVANGITLWQMHAAGTPMPTLSLVAGRQDGLLQVKWMGHVLTGFPLADLPEWCPFSVRVTTHQTLGAFDMRIADYNPLTWSGISTMLGPSEWHHVGVLSGSNDPDQPEVSCRWRDFALFKVD